MALACAPRLSRLPALTVAADATSTVDPGWDSRVLFPLQQWPQVVGKRRGILMAAGEQAWGAGVFWSGNADTSREHRPYRYYAEGSSAYAVYFESPDGHGENPMKWTMMDSDGRMHTVPSAMFGTDTPNAWGLRRTAHLVEVDAITPEKAMDRLHFVIRSARVLDATPEYPLVVEDVLRKLRKRFDAQLRADGEQIGALLERQRATVPQDHDMQSAPSPTVAVLPTWRDETRTFEATFRATYQERHTGPEQTRAAPCPSCPCESPTSPDGKPLPPVCAPCPRCVPREETFVPEQRLGWKAAAHYRVDVNGVLVGEERMPPLPL